jgi:energy-coupling factor transporter ATP-binding protein EcfA2
MAVTVDAEPIHNAKLALTRLKAWMNSRVEPIARSGHHEEWKRWQAEAAAIQASLERPQSVQVALVGTTGAGKSTLLNALLGVQLLQVGVAQSITSFVTRVRHAEGSGYRVEIDFSTLKEWSEEVDRLLNAAAPGDADDGEAKSIVNNLRRRAEAVYGVPLDSPESLARIPHLRPAADVQRVFDAGARTVQDFQDPQSMVKHLRSVVRAESAVWPLVKQVTISGAFPALRGGIELADLPGTNDLNDARVDVTREFIRNAPFVWLVFSMKRGITADGRDLLEREKILRTLVLSGSYHALQLIGTHADDIDPSVADQFGLDPDDHTNAELVSAYRSHFRETSRRVLAQVVDSLVGGAEDTATSDRMRQMARDAPIHAVSARAYNQMAGIVRANVDFGLTDLEQTGVPEVQRALRSIADEVGAGLAGRTALQRIEHLQSEIAGFFRARAAAGNPAVARAQAELDVEVTRLQAKTQRQLTESKAQLEERRRSFLARIKPMTQSSIQGVNQAAQSWQGIHWGTLRAIVKREGVFKSPSSGKRYDLNEDLVDPLLNQLPVTWEAYFTTDLGAVRERLAQRLTDFTVDFVDRARELSKGLGGRTHELLDRQLVAFRERITFASQQCALEMSQRVAEIRRQAVNGMSHAAKTRMVPAYETASVETGTGVKARMLSHIQPAARGAAAPIFSTIETDLVTRLGELESILVPLFTALERACVEQATTVAGNLAMDIDEARLTPEIRALLKELPSPGQA